VTKSFEYFEEGLLQYQNYETPVYVTQFEEDNLMVLKSDSTEANVKIKQVFYNEEEEIFLEQLLGLG
jgi:predicted metal-dependent RNase